MNAQAVKQPDEIRKEFFLYAAMNPNAKVRVRIDRFFVRSIPAQVAEVWLMKGTITVYALEDFK